MATNDITGDDIKSRVNSKKWDENWDLAFGTKDVPERPSCKYTPNLCIVFIEEDIEAFHAGDLDTHQLLKRITATIGDYYGR